MGAIFVPKTAADLANVPAGNIAATEVQAAITELDTEKAPILSPALTGQMDVLTTLTPTNGGTVTMTYTVGNAFFIDVSALVSGNTCTINKASWPDNTKCSAVTVIVLTGASVPTIAWPAGFTAPTLTASKETWFSAMSKDGGTTVRMFKGNEF